MVYVSISTARTLGKKGIIILLVVVVCATPLSINVTADKQIHVSS